MSITTKDNKKPLWKREKWPYRKKKKRKIEVTSLNDTTVWRKYLSLDVFTKIIIVCLWQRIANAKTRFSIRFNKHQQSILLMAVLNINRKKKPNNLKGGILKNCVFLISETLLRLQWSYNQWLDSIFNQEKFIFINTFREGKKSWHFFSISIYLHFL